MTPAGGHNVLGHVARGVGGRTVDLGRILARERAAAVRACAAVGVDDDLAAGQAAIALRAADDEAAGRVDQELRIRGDQAFGEARLDDVFNDGVADGLLRDFRGVLGRELHGIDFRRAAVDIAEGHLRLGVRTQPRQAAILAQFALALHQAVRVPDRGRHQVRRFIARVAEHQALVARALVQIVFRAAVHALGDVGRLLVVSNQHGAALVVDPVLGVVVPDAADGIPRDLDVGDVGGGGDFTGQDDQARVAQRFGCDTRVGVLREDGVQDGIGNLVGNLMRP
ncbi:hypothetical protein G6F22_015217 [Rhizopus arrhizus]|nr:hypothetical protein G6F22_015217 [Rhizopus arrhizus]